ncbi:hypothetical protein GCM10027615_49730 [Plantactinospora veratri]
MPQTGWIAGIPASPSVPPVTDVHRPAAVTVSSPMARVIIRTTTPRAYTTSGTVSRAKSAPVAAPASTCTTPTGETCIATRALA